MTHCTCGRALSWWVLSVDPGEGDTDPSESLDCADCPCGRRWTLLPDGTMEVWQDEPDREEAA